MRSVLGLLAISSFLVAADLPYVFVPGTPAKAAEVNANFSFLNSRIGSIEGGLSNVVTFYNPLTPKLTYTKSSATVGSTVSVNGVSYTLTAWPIVDPASGKKYKIAALSNSQILIYQGNRGSKVATIKIDGYDTDLSSNIVTYTRATNATTASVLYSAYSVITISLSASLYLVLQIDAILSSVTLNGTSYDFSNTTNHSNLLAVSSENISKLTQQLNEKLNFISISEIP